MYFIAEAFPSILETVFTTPLHLPLLFFTLTIIDLLILGTYCNAIAAPLQLSVQANTPIH